MAGEVLRVVGQADGALLETMTRVGCVIHGPTRTLARMSALRALDAGWAAFENPPPEPLAEAFCQGPQLLLGGMRVALRLDI